MNRNLCRRLDESRRENNLLQRKMNLLKGLYEELNSHEYNVLTNEFEEPPGLYRDMTRMKIYQSVEIQKKKVASLKSELEQETKARKCYE